MTKHMTNIPYKQDIITRKRDTLFNKKLSLRSWRHNFLSLVTPYFSMEPTVNRTERILQTTEFYVWKCIKLLKLNIIFKYQVVWKALREISGGNAIYIYSCKLVIIADYLVHLRLEFVLVGKACFWHIKIMSFTMRIVIGSLRYHNGDGHENGA